MKAAEGELVEMQCPELRILSEEDMSNPQHPDFACHKKQCKLLGHICLRERTRGTDCPLYLWLLKQPESQSAEGELAPCPVAKECEKATGMGCTSECLFVRGWEVLLRGREAQRHCDLQHMVEIDWLFERCPHSEPLMLATRRECDECMDELLKREAK